MDRVLAWLAPYAAAALIGAVLWTWTPLIGPAARQAAVERRLETARTAARAWEAHARGWKASFKASERNRSTEGETARAAVAGVTARCAAEVAEARRSARAIERIVTQEPTYDENRCPVRRLIDADELQRALQPAR